MREKHSHYDPDAVFAEAKHERVCPFEVQLELATKADAVVADYNYVFEPGTALRHLSRDELDQAILLVDEAHNLPIAVEKFSHLSCLKNNSGNVIEWLADVAHAKEKEAQTGGARISGR